MGAKSSKTQQLGRTKFGLFEEFDGTLKGKEKKYAAVWRTTMPFRVSK